MKQTFATEHRVPSDAPAVNGEPTNAKSTYLAHDDPALSLVLRVILTAQELHSDMMTLAETLSSQMNQLLLQMAAQRPNCCIASEQATQTAPSNSLHDQITDTLSFTSPLDQGWPSSQRSPIRPLAVHFTGREWDVLKMMLAGMSNQEIAGRLVIAVSTVKWYVNQLYSKLDVHSRDEAIYCARELILTDRMTAYSTQKFGRLIADELLAVQSSSVPVSAARTPKDARPLTF